MVVGNGALATPAALWEMSLPRSMHPVITRQPRATLSLEIIDQKVDNQVLGLSLLVDIKAL